MSKYDESDYHSATMQSTATLLSVGVVIITFANILKLSSPPFYFIVAITVLFMICSSMVNHISLYKINYLGRHPKNRLSLREFIDLNLNDSHFLLFNFVNLLLGGLTAYILYAAKFGGVGT